MARPLAFSAPLLSLTAALVGCTENTLSGIGDAGKGDGPAIQVEPLTLDFGTLADEDGAVVKTFTVKSVGTTDLTVEGIEISGQASGSFTLLTGELDFILPPGTEREIEVSFLPVGANSQSAQAIVSSDDEVEPKVPVALMGEGAIAELQITPDPLDFGRTYVGCAKENQVTITNVGSEELDVLAIEHSGGEFAINPASLPELPLTLAPGDSRKIDLTFTPLLEGDIAGTLSVTSTEPLGVRTAEQTGEGMYAATYEDRWDHPASTPADIIFSVDQSCSMDDDIAHLAANFGEFITQLSDYSSDWQILIANADNGCAHYSPAVITPDMSYVSIFQSNIQTGGAGMWTESLLTITSAAVEKTDAGECNAGFMRPNAMLHVIMVSDEHEQSAGYPFGTWWQPFVDQIIAKKGDAANVRLSAIAGPNPGGCVSAEAGLGYSEAVNYTGGVFLNLCSDWASPSNLQLLAEASVQLDTYSLSNPAIPDSVVVTVNENQVNNGWYYDEALNAVVFQNNAPEEGDSVTISYAAYATCD